MFTDTNQINGDYKLACKIHDKLNNNKNIYNNNKKKDLLDEKYFATNDYELSYKIHNKLNNSKNNLNMDDYKFACKINYELNHYDISNKMNKFEKKQLIENDYKLAMKINREINKKIVE